MAKHKVLVLVNQEFAAGFQLAGVDVAIAETPGEAEETLNNVLMTGKEFGIIGIDSSLNEGLSETLLNELEGRGYPVLVPFRARELYQWEKVEVKDDYTASLIRNAIGYDIKI
ncbi:MAG: V-type ATP synthase subunit F [bacterium]